jgi:pimeloyl-ACP methyl ester carboxylesterase
MNIRAWRSLLALVFFSGLVAVAQVSPKPRPVQVTDAQLVQVTDAQLVQVTDAQLVQTDETASPLPLEPNNVGEFLLARPSEPNGTLFVFYPGGKVPARAYEHWARALAAQGVTVAIPIMPLELAILGIYSASSVRDALLAKGWRAKRLVVGGHSLGGAMAGWYSAWLPVDGLVFMAAYPPWSIAEKTFPVLSIAAEFDGLATLEKVRASLPNLPPSAQLEVIPGGVHAFFGRYGTQAGDGQPTASREVFERQVLEKLSVFLERIAK